MKILRQIIKYWYWKLNCHTDEPFSQQLILYAIQGKIRGGKDLISVVYEIKQNMEKFTLSIEPIIACGSRDGDMENYNVLEIDSRKPVK